MNVEVCICHVGQENEFQFVLNFDPALACVITETKYLEQLGFSIPELATNIALQVTIGLIFIHHKHGSSKEKIINVIDNVNKQITN